MFRLVKVYPYSSCLSWDTKGNTRTCFSSVRLRSLRSPKSLATNQAPTPQVNMASVMAVVMAGVRAEEDGAMVVVWWWR